MKWSDISVPSGSWLTNTNNTGNGFLSDGREEPNSYNLLLDTPGTYLVYLYCDIEENSSSVQPGVRGIRLYQDEQNIKESFITPSAIRTSMSLSHIVTTNSNGYTRVRMGLYQSSGVTKTAINIFIVAFKII